MPCTSQHRRSTTCKRRVVHLGREHSRFTASNSHSGRHCQTSTTPNNKGEHGGEQHRERALDRTGEQLITPHDQKNATKRSTTHACYQISSSTSSVVQVPTKESKKASERERETGKEGGKKLRFAIDSSTCPDVYLCIVYMCSMITGRQKKSLLVLCRVVCVLRV